MNEVQKRYIEFTSVIKNKWTPHPGQIDLGKPLFNHGIDIFGQCGRNFGKTDFVCYALWRWAFLNPGSENYYFSPYMKQSNEILWETRRIQDFGHKSWTIDTNDTDLRIKLANGSFIKLDGSDNVEAYRGIKPKGLTVFDEFKDFRPEFYDAYDPNRAAHKSPLIIIGTPPDRECQYLEIAKEYKANSDRHFYHGPTSANPHIDKKWLEDKRLELIRKGEEDVWQREYEAIYVPGGVSKIFPMLTRDLVKPYKQLMFDIRHDLKKLEWFCLADPAAATCFAVLFGCINPYTKTIYLLDEIYEQKQSEMTVEKMGNRIYATLNQTNSRAEWWKGYDEAETWFANEMASRFGDGWIQTRKSLRKKTEHISLIKDIILNNRLVISDKCQKLFWEMDNYYKDKNDKIPKKNDHLIDCFRYLLDAANYGFVQEQEYVESKDENFRGARISDDFPDLDDWGKPIDPWASL